MFLQYLTWVAVKRLLPALYTEGNHDVFWYLSNVEKSSRAESATKVITLVLITPA